MNAADELQLQQQQQQLHQLHQEQLQPLQQQHLPQKSKADIQEYMKLQIKQRHKEQMELKKLETRQKDTIKKRLDDLAEFRKRQGSLQQQIQQQQLVQHQQQKQQQQSQPHSPLESQRFVRENSIDIVDAAQHGSRPLYESQRSLVSTPTSTIAPRPQAANAMLEHIVELEKLQQDQRLAAHGNSNSNVLQQSSSRGSLDSSPRSSSARRLSMALDRSPTASSSASPTQQRLRSSATSPQHPERTSEVSTNSHPPESMVILQSIWEQAKEINKRLSKNPDLKTVLLSSLAPSSSSSLPLPPPPPPPPPQPPKFNNMNEADTSFGSSDNEGFFFQQNQRFRSPTSKDYQRGSPNHSLHSSRASSPAPSPSFQNLVTRAMAPEFQQQFIHHQRRSPSPQYQTMVPAVVTPPLTAQKQESSLHMDHSLGGAGSGMVAGFATRRSSSRGRGFSEAGGGGGGGSGGRRQVSLSGSHRHAARYDKREEEAAVFIQRWFREQFEVKRRNRLLQERRRQKEAHDEKVLEEEERRRYEKMEWVVADEDGVDVVAGVVSEKAPVILESQKDPYSVLNVLQRVKPGFGERILESENQSTIRSSVTKEKTDDLHAVETGPEESGLNYEDVEMGGNNKENNQQESDLKTPSGNVTPKQMEIDDTEESVAGRYSETFEDVSSVMESAAATGQSHEPQFDTVVEEAEEPIQTKPPPRKRAPLGESSQQNINEKVIPSQRPSAADSRRAPPPPPLRQPKSNRAQKTAPSSSSLSFEESSDLYMHSEDDDYDYDSDSEIHQHHHYASGQRRRGSVESDDARGKLYGLSPKSLGRKFDDEMKFWDSMDFAGEQLNEVQRLHFLSGYQQDKFSAHQLSNAKMDQHAKDFELARQDRELKELRVRNLPTEAVPGFGPALAPAAGPSTSMMPHHPTPPPPPPPHLPPHAVSKYETQQYEALYNYGKEDFDIVSDFIGKDSVVGGDVAPAAMEAMEVYSEAPSMISSYAEPKRGNFGDSSVESMTTDSRGVKTMTTATTTDTKSSVPVSSSTYSSYNNPDESINLDVLLEREKFVVPETTEGYLAALDARLRLAQEYTKRELKLEKERLERVVPRGREAEREERYQAFQTMILAKLKFEMSDIALARKRHLDSEKKDETAKQSRVDDLQSTKSSVIPESTPVPVLHHSKTKKQSRQTKQHPIVSASTSSIPEELLHDDKATGASYTSVSEDFVVDIAHEHHNVETSLGSDSISIHLEEVEEKSTSNSISDYAPAVTPRAATATSSVTPTPKSPQQQSIAEPPSSHKESISSSSAAAASASTVTSIVAKLQKVSAHITQMGDLERKKERLEKSKVVGEMILGEAEKKMKLARDVVVLEAQLNGIVDRLGEMMKQGNELAELKRKEVVALAVVKKNVSEKRGEGKPAAVDAAAGAAAGSKPKVPLSNVKTSDKEETGSIQEDFSYSDSSAAESIPLELSVDVRSRQASVKSIAESIKQEVELVRQNLGDLGDGDGDIPMIIDSVQSDMMSIIEDISSYGGGSGSSVASKKQGNDAVSSISSFGGSTTTASLKSKSLALDSVSVAAPVDSVVVDYDEDFEAVDDAAAVAYSTVDPNISHDEESIEAIERLQRLQSELEEKEAKMKQLMQKKKEQVKAAKSIHRKQQEDALLKKIQELEVAITKTEREIQEPVIPVVTTAGVAAVAGSTLKSPAETTKEVDLITPTQRSISKPSGTAHGLPVTAAADPAVDEIVEDIQTAMSDDISSFHGSHSANNVVASAASVLPASAVVAEDISSYGGSASVSSFGGRASSTKASNPESAGVVPKATSIPVADDISSYAGSMYSSGTSSVVVPASVPIAVASTDANSNEYEDDFTNDEISQKPMTLEPTVSLPQGSTFEGVVSIAVDTEIEEEIEEEVEEEVQYEDDFSSEKQPIVVAVPVPAEVVAILPSLEHPKLDDTGLLDNESKDIEYEEDFVSENPSDDASNLSAAAGVKLPVHNPEKEPLAEEGKTSDKSILEPLVDVGKDLEKQVSESRVEEAKAPEIKEIAVVNFVEEEIEEDIPSSSSDGESSLIEADTKEVVAAPHDLTDLVNAKDSLVDEGSVGSVSDAVVEVAAGPLESQSVSGKVIEDVDIETKSISSPHEDDAPGIDQIEQNQTDNIADSILKDMVQESVDAVITISLSPTRPPMSPVLAALPDPILAKDNLSEQANRIANLLFEELLHDLDEAAELRPSVPVALTKNLLPNKTTSKEVAAINMTSLEELAQVTRSVSVVQSPPEVEEVIRPQVSSTTTSETRTPIGSATAVSDLPSAPLSTSLTMLLSAGIPLTSTQFADEFVDLLLQRLPQAQSSLGYDCLPQFDSTVIQELVGDEHLDYALKSRYALLLSAMQESMEDIFSLHSTFGKDNRVSAAFTGSIKKRGMMAVLPPRPVTLQELKEKVKKAVSGWTAYSEIYGENLDTMLIEEVKDDENEWKNLEYELELVRENTYQEVLADVIQDTINAAEIAIIQKRAVNVPNAGGI
ncbi:hypothetical protein BDR26DRAFT_867146 [Obelidium mucronatum]|nr:hypothetical protein BDR26DRAFT_867146 [Obelidium mucronatum]